ncbi:MAG: hypothetical protein ACKVRP_10415 [Bacteroidota bacterium]
MKLSFLLLAVHTSILAGPDYLIVEHTDRLTVYSKYQQETTGQERQMIAPYVPMKILKADDHLSDGFTRCMQVEINGEVFYLLKQKNGGLVHSGPLGAEENFRIVTVVADTVQVLSDNSVRFAPMKSAGRTLPAGQKVVRVFRNRNGKYYGTLNTPLTYGWLNLTGTKEGRDWKTVREIATALDSLPAAVIERVRARLDEANRVLVNLFQHFNGELNQQLQAPRWNIESSAKAIICTLHTTFPPEQFHQSTQYLLKDIENIALAGNLTVAQSSGTITLRLR